MPLKLATGNMYDFVTHMWNPVKGRCPYACSYCYVSRIFKRFGKEQREPYLDERESRANLGEGNTIFVCDSIDLFAPDIDGEWRFRCFMETSAWPNNIYLWHTKNPALAVQYLEETAQNNNILCATIESDIWSPDISEAPNPVLRFAALRQWQGRRMITVEPIMQFNQWAFGDEIISCQPEQVNIGADSGRNNLPEPEPHKIAALVEALSKRNIKVHLKKNLRRLLPEHELYGGA